MTRPLQAKSLTFAAVVFLASAAGAAGQIPSEGLCDTQFATQLVGGVQVSNCRSAILNLIANEKVGIDVAFWYMSDARYVNSLNIAFNTNKVPVRVLVDERANNSHPSNASILTSLVSTHIPMREKLPDLTYGLEILHFKMMLFTGQNVVVFSKANFTPEEYVPDTTNNTYSDEAIFFTNDNRLTNSFRRRFDDLWTDLTRYRNYANISGTPTRTYDPLLPRDSSMNFVPLQKFQDRAKARMDAEPSGGQMDIIVFRTIDHVLPDAVINAMAPPRGVTVRLITDYGEYRNPDRPWDAAHKDRMWKAGARMKVGNHGGIVHEGAIVLQGLGEVIFGSSNWSSSSDNKSGDEHNFFYTPGFNKPWFFQWFDDQFTRKWNDTTNYVDFVPLPPDTPTSPSPADKSSGQSTSSVTLRWQGGPWAHFYDIYFGTSSNPTLLAGNVQIGNPSSDSLESYTVSNLQPGTTYYWKITGKTWAQLGRTGGPWSFTTSGTSGGGGGSTPYGGTPAVIPGTFQAENFDEGGQNVAYYDTTSTNSGGAYRPTTGVDIEATTDSGGGYDVGWTKAGEWMKYTVNVGTTGTYQFQARVANTAAGGNFRVEVDGVAVASLDVPNTGGWQAWQTVTTTGISLTAGQHVIRVVFATQASNGSVGNFNWFQFDTASGGSTSTPYGGTPAPIPGTFQAENFDDGGQNVAYSDTTPTNSGGSYRPTTGVDIEPTTDSGGGYDVGWTKAGEWMKYTVNVTAGGTYQLQTRVANAGSGGSFRVEVDGSDKTGSIAVPNTGGWQNWQTITTTGISLTSGQHVIRVVFTAVSSSGGAGNFNWFSFQ